MYVSPVVYEVVVRERQEGIRAAVRRARQVAAAREWEDARRRRWFAPLLVTQVARYRPAPEGLKPGGTTAPLVAPPPWKVRNI